MSSFFDLINNSNISKGIDEVNNGGNMSNGKSLTDIPKLEPHVSTMPSEEEKEKEKDFKKQLEESIKERFIGKKTVLEWEVFLETFDTSKEGDFKRLHEIYTKASKGSVKDDYGVYVFSEDKFHFKFLWMYKYKITLKWGKYRKREQNA